MLLFVVQWPSRVWLFATPWTATHQASLSNSQNLLKPMSIKSVMPSNRLILWCPVLSLPSIFPSIMVFFSDSVLHIRWPKYLSALPLLLMSPVLSKNKLAEYQPRSTNLWIEFKQLITNVEITDKAQTLVKHTYACHTHTFTKPGRNLRPFMFSLEKGRAVFSSIFAWRIPWTEEPDGLQSMSSQRLSD